MIAGTGSLSGVTPVHTQWRGVVVSGVGLINEVNRHRARLVLGWVTVWAGKPSRYVTSHLGQLSLPSLRGR